jgi:large subunit ribosomal protein L3
MNKKFLLVRKVGMTQIVEDSGLVVPVTVLLADENVVVDFRTFEKHGYDAIVLGSGLRSKKRHNKPLSTSLRALGHDKVFGTINEFRVGSHDGFSIKQVLDVSIFELNEKVLIQKSKHQELA